MRLSYPSELPISSHRDEIVRTIINHQVVIIAGDTGSGKTTQVPKMCLEAGRGKKRLIGCTQPRRIAAVSVAERVAEEIGAPNKVGYQIRFQDRTTRLTQIKFMTDGILLAETKNDRDLKRYDTLIIDEAHERSLNIDFLLGYTKILLARRKGLKLIISSATLDTEKFSSHFNDAPIINVSGRTYPITTQYLEPIDTDQSDLGAFVEQAVKETLAVVNDFPPGDVLIFMPTERDILDCKEMLEKKLKEQALVLPLFGRLHSRDQRKIFRQTKRRKIIVATNIAETSLTVPGIRYVIDTGLARISRYNPRARTTSLQVQRISQASCDQRSGRCGRTGPGHCIRLYTEEDYESRQQYTLPEIQRSNLAEVILQMINLRLGDSREFPFLDPPSVNSIRDGYKMLRELGALTTDGQLTRKGKIMARLPLDPCISRIIIEAAENASLREIKIIAAGLSIQDPRIRPLDLENKADEMHRRFIHKKSDFLSLLNIWEGYQVMAGKAGSKSKLKKYCKTNYFSWQRMREWQDVHDQIHQLLKGNRHFKNNTQPASYDAIHQSLLSGFLRNIGQKKDKNIFVISGGRQVMVFPGSSQFNKAGQWIVSASFMETGRLYAMTVASIDVRWLERIGGDLCRYSWSEPHWEKRSGRVVALEKVTLFSLVIVSGRKVNYAKTSEQAAREAREIFLNEALVTGELGGRYSFYKHNRDLIKKLLDMEHQTRRKDILVDDATIYSFYDTRLGMVYDRHSLNREIKKHRNDRFLWMTEEDIIQTSVDEDELYRFPKRLQAGNHAIHLEYCFEPGNEADGITADIPLSLTEHFNPVFFEWLVPGLIEEKIQALLKGLPKKIRKRLIPLPETTARIMDTLELYDGSLYAGLEKTISKLYQVKIHRTEWQPDKLPLHLKMRFRLVDKNRKILQTSRSYNDLLDFGKSDESQPDDESISKKMPEVQREIRSWDFPSPPQAIPLINKRNILTGYLYPMLLINEDARCIELHYTADRSKSLKNNREGIRYLYEIQFPKEIKALTRECKNAVTSYSASWLSLGLKVPATELTTQLKNFLLDDIFSITHHQLLSGKEFATHIENARNKKIIKMCRSHLDLLLKLLSQRRQVSSRIEDILRTSKGKHDPRTVLSEELSKHLQEILPCDFLEKCKLSDLRDASRYLKALNIRIDRAEHSPAKDKKKGQQVAAIANRMNTLPNNLDLSANCLESLSEYRKMVEEFRISIFAPEIGTAFPVSEKRLKKKWQEVENTCLRIE